MSKARFAIAFEGEPFEGGAIDVRDLAPTLRMRPVSLR